jgi:predicted DNA-binding transcriptional regulator YafY
MAVREEAVRPRPGFNLHEYWERAKQRFETEVPSVTVTLRVSDHVRRMIPGATLIREEGDGHCVVHVTVPHGRVAVSYALSYGPDMVVLDPPEVRDAVIEAARTLLTTYLSPQTATS